jgi:hypothetical protein
VNWIFWTGLILCAIAAIAAGLAAYGTARWAEATDALLSRLEAGRRTAAITRYDASELEGLPAPVRRYFRTALKDGQPIIAAVTVEHVGTFRMNLAGEQWQPFTSKQRVVTNRPGFVWNARIAMMSGIPVHVHDAYVSGEGVLVPSILGLFSLAVRVAPHDLAEGEFARFFAEAVWYPTALLPSQGVDWRAVDDRSATATLADGNVSVTMLVSFDQSGLIESTRVEARAAMVGNRVVPTPWEARCADYQQRNGMLVPLDAETSWLQPDGRQPYWRGTIKSIAYEFADIDPPAGTASSAVVARHSVPGATRPTALTAVKLVHTVVWAFFAACILAIPVASWRGEHGTAAWLAVVVLAEVVVLLLNRWRCPLTSVAERYTDERRANFDIYLPEWLARHNKSIFGALYLAGIAFALANWLLAGVDHSYVLGR